MSEMKQWKCGACGTLYLGDFCPACDSRAVCTDTELANEVKSYQVAHGALEGIVVEQAEKINVLVRAAQADLLVWQHALAEKDEKIADLKAEVERLRAAGVKSSYEVEQMLAQALGGFLWYKDDQKNWPGATEKDGVCVGEYTPEILAEMAAKEIKRLRGLLETVQQGVQQVGGSAVDWVCAASSDLPSAKDIEIERLREIVKWLPQTKDRKPIASGMTVYDPLFDEVLPVKHKIWVQRKGATMSLRRLYSSKAAYEARNG